MDIFCVPLYGTLNDFYLHLGINKKNLCQVAKLVRGLNVKIMHSNLVFLDEKNTLLKGCSLDTLAQLPKIDPDGNKEKLQKRAKSKALTHSLSVKLLQIDSPLHRAYWNTYYCATAIVQNGDVFTSKYCKNRWCIVCNRIRTGELINGYLPPLKAFKEPYFVTLTKPTVSSDMLKITLKNDYKAFRKILNRLDKRGIKPNGIRKTECTARPNDQYHPHFHLIIDTKDHAELIVKEWLKEYPTACEKAQDIRTADDDSIIELMKYFTKLLPSRGTQDRAIYVYKLDIIFQAMIGNRVYQPFGNVKKVRESIDDIISEKMPDLPPKKAVYVWSQKINDWFDTKTSELLSFYTLTDKDKDFMNNLK